MDEYTQAKSTSASTFAIIFAGFVAVLVLLYALFGGGSVATDDPAAIGTTQEGAPAVPGNSPDAPAAPVVTE